MYLSIELSIVVAIERRNIRAVDTLCFEEGKHCLQMFSVFSLISVSPAKSNLFEHVKYFALKGYLVSCPQKTAQQATATQLSELPRVCSTSGLNTSTI